MDFGWTATGKAPKWVLRPAEGRPEGRVGCLPGSSPAKILPGRPISGPEALLRNIGLLIRSWGYPSRTREGSIFGVWPAPGAWKTILKGGGFGPHLFKVFPGPPELVVDILIRSWGYPPGPVLGSAFSTEALENPGSKLRCYGSQPRFFWSATTPG